MKTIISSLAILVLAFTVSARTVTHSKDSVQKLARDLAAAYEDKKLGSLDAKKPYRGTFKIVIEHSLAGDEEPGRFVTRTFSSMKKAERWLRSRTTQGLPNRQSRKFKACGTSVCSYDFEGGILHNQLYLKKFTFGKSGGKYYIKTIYLLDGD